MPPPCKLPSEHCFGFREVNVEVGEVSQEEIAGGEAQDAAKVSGSSAIDSDDRGKKTAVLPILVINFASMARWTGVLILL